MKVFLSIFLVGLILTGCSERIPRSHLKARAFQLNMEGLRGPVTVTGTDGRTSSAVAHFNILGDSAMWIEPESDLAVAVPTIQIDRFTIKDRLSGGLWGMIIGLGAGTVAAVAIGSDEGNEGNISGAGILAMLAGEVGGLLIGTMIGANYEYIIEP